MTGSYFTGKISAGNGKNNPEWRAIIVLSFFNQGSLIFLSMKVKLATVLFSMVLIGGIATAFQSCDDDDPVTANEFTVDGETFALTHGYLELYQDVHPISSASVYKWSVILESTDPSNIWHWVRFTLNSKTGTTLAPGTYLYNGENTLDDLTFFFGEVVTNYDISSGEGQQYEAFESGTVTVARSDSKYTVLFDVTVSGGTKVKGSYTGSLRIEE